jgi:hypothetical protein
VIAILTSGLLLGFLDVAGVAQPNPSPLFSFLFMFSFNFLDRFTLLLTCHPNYLSPFHPKKTHRPFGCRVVLGVGVGSKNYPCIKYKVV